MKTFKDIEFEPHTTGEGLMGRLFFPNGYGISVVRFKLSLQGMGLSLRNGYGSYTENENEWEVAVLEGNEDDAELTYTTPITDDVIGYLTDDEVTDIMRQIQELPSNEQNDKRSVATDDDSSNSDDKIKNQSPDIEQP